ncbi:MAG: hypothetical protein U0Q18_35140 [Bryobacteraceae bacterium]
MCNVFGKPRLLIGPLAAAFLCVASAFGAGTAHPGTVNYLEGKVELNGSVLPASAAGSADVEQNQVLRTENGKAEMLLTPGVFLRVGDHSAVRMISPSLTDTSVQLLNGNALIEVTEIFPQNHLRVVDADASAQLLKKGIYQFDATQPRIAVYDGKAVVESQEGDVTVTKGKELALASGPLKPQKFDRKKAEEQDGLYQWSSLRSEYLAEASWDSARTIIVDSGPWWGGGWYWSPYWGMYSFLPANGFLYSPFGFGFYSPWAAWRTPLHGGRSWGHAAGGRGTVIEPHRGAFVEPRMGGHSFTGGFGGGRIGGGFPHR